MMGAGLHVCPGAEMKSIRSFAFCFVFLIYSMAGLFVPAVGQQSSDSGDDLFRAEFTKLFGRRSGLSLTAEQYLRQLVSGETDDEEFRSRIKQLGSDDYQQRQKAEAFLFSVPVLPEKYRDEALTHPDMEVRYRLKSVFSNRKDRVESLIVAALKSIRANRSSNSLRDVLMLLQTGPTSTIQLECRQTIHAIVNPNNQDIIREFLASESAAVRILCASTLAELDPNGAAQSVATLLMDSDRKVRFEVAVTVLNLLPEKNIQKQAIRSLAELLVSQESSIPSRAERVLRAVTGLEFGNISYGDKEHNRLVAKRWHDWLAKNLDSTELRLPLKDFLRSTSRLDGNTLIAKDNSLVLELDADHKEIFRMEVPGVLSAEKTRQGNYLLFSYSGKWLREYTPEKKIVWSVDGVSFNNAMPLENGNALVTIGPESTVRELNPETRKPVWEFKTSWWPNDACRLENGNTLIGGKGGIVEVTPDGKTAWQFNNPESSTIVVAKPVDENRILVGWTNGLARVIDRGGKTLWEYRTSKLSDVYRDSRGHTFVAGANEIVELDTDKKVVWRMPKKSTTATVRR